MLTPILAVLLITYLISAALTLVVRVLAPRVGLTDHPDERRKLHRRAIPLGGGVAVFLATVLVLGGLLLIDNPWQAGLRQCGRELFGLLAAGMIIVLVGLVDDRVGLRGRHKILGQLLAVSILVANGLTINRLGILGEHFELGMLAIPFTYFWLLGATNSINLLDGIDGLASMLGIVLVSTFAIMAWFVGQTEIALVSLVFAGSLLGFIRFNFPPASIFLGDAGSMLIGLVVGALAIQGSMKGSGTVLLAAPLAVWTLPILDCTAAILRRKLTGRSIYATDRGHLHHHLLQRLGNERRVLAILTACSLLTSLAALVSLVYRTDWVGFAIGPAVVAVFIATGVFGRAESLLLVRRLRSLGHSFLRLSHNGKPNGNGHLAGWKSAIRWQGSGDWEGLWSMLVSKVDEWGLTYVRFDVNLPMLHEGYTSTWERPYCDDTRPRWNLEIPLLVAEQRFGHVAAQGYAAEDATCHDVGQLLEIIKFCESYVHGFIEEKRRDQRQASPADAGIQVINRTSPPEMAPEGAKVL